MTYLTGQNNFSIFLHFPLIERGLGVCLYTKNQTGRSQAPLWPTKVKMGMPHQLAMQRFSS
jgi:hypothetical protein